jgi:molybdenum cofactor cytidylyltransferase
MRKEMESNRGKSLVSSIVLAAGASRRMGQPKMLLPWGSTTVIGKVLETLIAGGVYDPVVISGRAEDEMRQALKPFSIRWVHNPDYEHTEMLQSLQLGLSSLPHDAQAFLVVLGDQPQIEAGIVQQVIQTYQMLDRAIIIPSFQMRRGHPWLVRRDLWQSLAGLPADANMRQFLNRHVEQIEYLNVDTPSVLMDLDTPEDYQRQKPNS